MGGGPSPEWGRPGPAADGTVDVMQSSGHAGGAVLRPPPQARVGGVLEDAVAGGILREVARTGVAIVRGAIPKRECRRLVQEADTERARFLSLPAHINGVQQRADQLSVRLGDPRHPRLDRLDALVRRAFAGDPDGLGAEHFVPNEARYMRYRGTDAGLGAHRDGKCYALAVCVFSLSGSAPFIVHGDDHDPPVAFMPAPGDLVILRAPGLAGLPDGRRRHSVGAPLLGERVSLTLRMVRGTLPARAGGLIGASGAGLGERKQRRCAIRPADRDES